MKRYSTTIWILVATVLTCASLMHAGIASEARAKSHLGVSRRGSSSSRLPQSQSQQAQAQQVQRMVAVTVDDLPGAVPGNDFALGDLKQLQKLNRENPAILRAHHVPAIGFVNEYKLQVKGERDARAALLQSWLDAGLTLGDHTYAHDDFQTTPLDKFEDETIRGEVVTSVLMKAAGQTEKYFRHPYLDTGPTAEAKAAFEAFLKERGYTVAPVTLEDADYVFNDVLEQAYEKKDKKLADKTRKAYLDYVDTVFDYAESTSRTVFGREIPQVLLIHDNELNTECLDALLTKLEKRGYKFIPLAQALADPSYATPDNYIGADGISWILRWSLALGKHVDFKAGPEPPDWANKIFDQMRKERQGTPQT
ncbi:MAG: polysaccharide deacetylase family protein [Candidatus Acidiferrales bacterium]